MASKKTAYQGFASLMADIDPGLFGPESGDGTRDDTTPCADCGMAYFERMGTYWLTDDDLWAQVVGDDSIALCPSCFTRRARAAGIPMHWRAVRESEST